MRWLLAVVFCSVLCFVLCVDDGQQNGITVGINATEATTTTTVAPDARVNDTNAEVVTIPTLPYYDEPSETTTSSTKGRALNFTFPDTGNKVAGENKTGALDDLSLDDIPMLMRTHDTTATPTMNVMTQAPVVECVEGEQKYAVGSKFNRGCEESCSCEEGGKVVCMPRCEPPLFRKGWSKDAYCRENATDECCVLLICSHDTEPEPLEGCVHKNQTFHRGEMFNDGCEAVCSCGDSGSVLCKPRCPQAANKSASDQCVPVPDPADPCCTVVFCDVTLGDHEINRIGGTEETTADSQPRLKSADALNSTSAIIHFLGEPELDSNLTAEFSEDQVTWNSTTLDGVIVHGLKPGRTYYIRVVSGGATSNAVVISLPKDVPAMFPEVEGRVAEGASNQSAMNASEGENVFSDDICRFRGHNYTLGQEFNDGCVAYCICTDKGVDCSPIECPTEFGLDLLDPTCIQWETKPRGFNPTPPKCCPDHVRCLNNGSCTYMGHSFPNWAEIPQELSGCEKKCFCELGNVTCQEVCPPVAATPPAELPCAAKDAMLHNLPGDDCCYFWVCPARGGLNQTEMTPHDTNTSSSPSPPMHKPPHPIHHNILAPFGLNEAGHPTEQPLPGPVVLPHPDDTSVIPGPPYLAPHDQHLKTFGFKPSKDEGVHGPPPFVVKPTKEDFEKKHKYTGAIHFTGEKVQTSDKTKTKPKGSKTDFKPTIPPEEDEEEEDYEDENSGGHFPDVPLFHHHPHRTPQVIYVNHPDVISNVHPNKPNEIFQQQPRDPSFYNQPGKHYDEKHLPRPQGIPGNVLHHQDVYQAPIKHPAQGPFNVPRPHVPYQGDEEAVLHYHSQELPDDPRIIAKEILAHLQHHADNEDQVFGVHHDSNTSDINFSIHHAPINHTGFEQPPHGFPPQPNHPGAGVQVQVLEPLDEHTVRLAFSVPPILVGLHGRVEVRYTATKHEDDPSTWELQVLAPPGDLIATPQLHFDLGNLLPDTTYYIIIKIILRDLSNAPQSQVLTVRTLPDTGGTTLPPQIMVDPGLAVAEVNSTWVQLAWRKFSDFELQFIDGVQLRYREQDGKVFSATPLIHRSVTSYTIEDLKPNMQYEVGLFFIPFPGQTTELQSERNIEIITTLENDPYKFEIHLEILTTKSTSVEVTWTGVPYPEDKYVNIYRVIYQSDTGKEDFNSFKVAKRDSTPKIMITDLKPTTRYRLWLEAYLTNGRTKKSNVQDFVSKPGGVVSASSSHQGKLSGTPPTMEPGDYYGPLVAVAILAALAIMAALILLLVLMRKHGQNKAAITTTRKSQSAYDNPSYKTCENDPQATAAANGNGVARERLATEESA